MDITSSLPLPTKESLNFQYYKNLHHMQVEHLQRQLKDKGTLAMHTIRNKSMETQRRNTLINEVRRINNDLGKGSLPYYDKQFYGTRNTIY